MKIDKLRELARLYSVQVTYEDAAGKKRNASRESLLAALKMRLPDGLTPDEALRARTHEVNTRVLEPVTVVWGRRPLVVEARLPVDVGEGEYELRLEDGETRGGRVTFSDAMWRDEEFVGRTATIPGRVPHGYHVLRLTIAGKSYETFVIAAPLKAHAPREKTWGVFVPLYAAGTAKSWGAGDIGDLQAYREWVTSLGGGVVATLPMLAALDEEPSPYSPVSRLFWNELYLDLDRVPEFDAGDRDEAAIARLRNAELVDYEGVRAEKQRVLQRMCERFTPDEEYQRFASHAKEYAEFRGDARYHSYVQYRMAQQMRAAAEEAKRKGVGLYLDFPLGVNPAGYDAHRYAEHFAKGVSVGAPPDLFFTKGQNWGFPPLDPDAIRERRHDYFRACIRHHVEHAGILRIDHVMGLHRLFWIPYGGEAKDGVYVRYPEEELYAILILESTRAKCAIVGEDLGTVPQYVPRMMSKHGLRRMYVVQYELKPDDAQPVSEPAAASVASINTHDMPTFAGFWGEQDVDDRVEQGLLDEKGAVGERENREKMRAALKRFLTARGLLSSDREDDRVAVLDALLAYLSGSAAEIVLVNLEDLWLETEPQNVPGVPERSWRRRFRLDLESSRADETVTRILRNVNERRKVHGTQT